MKLLSRKVFSMILYLLGLVSVLAGASAPLTGIQLHDGDTVVFCGDSITHQCLYTQYVEDYVYTRFPNRRIQLVNAGVSGDRAGDALLRFSEDVASHKPQVVTVLLGMNDGQYQHFNHEIFARYEQDMGYLMDRIAELGAQTILMGPSMYDSRVSQTKPPAWVAKDSDQVRQVTRYYNPVLAFYGAWLRDRASDRGLGYVEMIPPMSRVTELARIQNPEFTMIPDAVHPNANGHAVMAAAMIEHMQLGGWVGSILLQRAEDDTWEIETTHGAAAELVTEDAVGLTLRYTAAALPWVLPKEARDGYRRSEAGTRLSRELLRVVGLPTGRYTLSIDQTPVGAYSTEQLAGGVELQEIETTPQYQQALAVAELNKERNDRVVRPLRDLWLNLRSQRSHPDTPEAKRAYQAWKSAFDAQCTELERQSQDYVDRIYATNQPHPRMIRLRPVNPQIEEK